MNLLMLAAIILGIVGLAALVAAVAHAEPDQRRARTVFRLVGGTALVLTFSVWALLRYAEPTVCAALGGASVINGPDRVCRNEWGGNGNNDPGQSWVPWA